MSEPLFIGVDPGFSCGVAIYRPDANDVYAEVIRTTKRHGDDTARLQKILANLAFVLTAGGVGSAERVILGVETQFGGRSPKFASDTARGPAAVRGMMVGLAAARGWEVVEVSPGAAKRAMTGNAKASKQQVQAMCEKRFGQHLAFDAADAVAIAVAAEAQVHVVRVLTDAQEAVR